MAKIPIKKKSSSKDPYLEGPANTMRPALKPTPALPQMDDPRKRQSQYLQTARQRMNGAVDTQLRDGTIESIGTAADLLELAMRMIDIACPAYAPTPGQKPGKTRA